MIRTKTTFIVGAGASCELQMPGGEELLARVAGGLDHSRYGTELQTRDSILIARYLGKMAERTGNGAGPLHVAADRIRIASRMGRSIDTVIDQNDTDQYVGQCGKLAIVHFICQAEAKSTLRLAPRVDGDLPIQGTDNWLVHLGQLITSGVPRSKLESCFDNVSIISFNYDRSIEHFMPFALMMSHGLPMKDAQRIVAQKLKVYHPYGNIGRLPWQTGEASDVEWGTDQPWNILNLTGQIRTYAEAMRDTEGLRSMRASVVGAKRLVFLGFGFHPQNVDLLIDYPLSHEPELLMTLHEMSEANKKSVIRMMRRKTAVERDDLFMTSKGKSYEMMRDYSLLLES